METLTEGKFYYSTQDGLHFEAGKTKVWSIQDGWQVADLIDGEFKNHHKFADLEEAIKNALFRQSN